MNNTDKLNEWILQSAGAGQLSIADISDGQQTFGELYDQRDLLICTILNFYPDISWKTKKHFNDNIKINKGYFIAGMYTPFGQATFYLREKYWELMHVAELDKAPNCDNMSFKEALIRVFALGDIANRFHDDGEDGKFK
ncbi:MAG: hypothetical protein IKQ06_01645 [Bacilli bacterium]|nr:hypothetical protein [Bacilli bacterium]